jgi:PKD repeat protein
MLLSLCVLVVSVPAGASTFRAQKNVSLTITSTTLLSATSGGTVQVIFNSVDLTEYSPQAYSFGVTATTSPGLTITKLSWRFGDGVGKDVPYSAQSEVSDVQYHAYSTPGTYTVSVIAYDSVGDAGYAQVTVNWVTPVPEYSSYGLALLFSLLLVPVLLRRRLASA